MRDAEGLVQVQVGDIAAELSGIAKSHHGVQVGAVDVDLAAMLMDDLADLGDGLFEHAVRRGIGDHQRRQVGAVLLGLGPQIPDIDIASLSHCTTTTFRPAICAEAGLVPWAELGIRQTLRWSSPRLAW